jgi:mono/diheme cytochrome c family protein
VNSQVNYIIYAALILFAVGSMSLAIQKIPFASTDEKSEEVFSGTKARYSHTFSEVAEIGKIIFMSHCAACHNLYKDGTGPSLLGFENRGPWSERKNLYEWIRNPGAFMEKNSYARSLKEKFGSMMTAFPDLSDEEIDAIATYIMEADRDIHGY